MRTKTRSPAALFALAIASACASSPPPARTPEPAAAPLPEPDETRAEAARSEAALTREEKRELQVALQWAGVYDSTIDGLFAQVSRQALLTSSVWSRRCASRCRAR